MVEKNLEDFGDWDFGGENLMLVHSLHDFGKIAIRMKTWNKR